MNYLKKLDIKLVPGEYENPLKGQIKGAKQVYTIFKAIKDKHVQTAIAVYLTNKLEAISYHVLGVGTETNTLIDSKEVFGLGFVLKAGYFIIVRNHPNGDANPTEADLELISKIDYQSDVMELALLDYIVVGDPDSNKQPFWNYYETIKTPPLKKEN